MEAGGAPPFAAVLGGAGLVAPAGVAPAGEAPPDAPADDDGRFPPDAPGEPLAPDWPVAGETAAPDPEEAAVAIRVTPIPGIVVVGPLRDSALVEVADCFPASLVSDVPPPRRSAVSVSPATAATNRAAKAPATMAPGESACHHGRGRAGAGRGAGSAAGRSTGRSGASGRPSESRTAARPASSTSSAPDSCASSARRAAAA